MSQWIKYSEQKPEKAGVYLWRMDINVDGVKLIVRDDLIYHTLDTLYGKEIVELLPRFAEWHNFRKVVPKSLEWAEDDNSKPDIEVEGFELILECPFCHKVPDLKATGGGGLHPHRWNKFWLHHSCEWVCSDIYHNPKNLIKFWNNAVSK
ncbi:hypothetical protein [Proteus faecis]|uniref:hypothetical protein n=1 Tax=Proteus faecis TaxID=2050967 RepID=UPI003075D448